MSKNKKLYIFTRGDISFWHWTRVPDLAAFFGEELTAGEYGKRKQVLHFPQGKSPDPPLDRLWQEPVHWMDCYYIDCAVCPEWTNVGSVFVVAMFANESGYCGARQFVLSELARLEFVFGPGKIEIFN